MSINDVDRELGQLQAAGPPFELSLPVEKGATLSATLEAIEAMAVTFMHVTLSSDLLRSLQVNELKAIADALCTQMSYLMEAIAPIEVDQDSATVQCRSEPPNKTADAISYYELVVNRDGITLSRYSKPSGGGTVRHKVPAVVTREVFQRIASDFVDVLP